MRHRFFTCALICAASSCAWADAEHERIATERNAANAKLAEQERGCNEKFVVSGCMEAARKENRMTLGRLRREEIALDEARRRAAADARRKEIADKAAAQQVKASDAAASEPEARVRRAPAPVRAPAVSAAHLQGLPASGVSREEQERINTEKYEAKQRAAEEHREAVARRNAERAAQGKAVAPLSEPSAASGSGQ